MKLHTNIEGQALLADILVLLICKIQDERRDMRFGDWLAHNFTITICQYEIPDGHLAQNGRRRAKNLL